MSVERAFDGKAELVLDDRLSPILVVTWFGSASAKTRAAFHAWLEAKIAGARARGEHLALIHDWADGERREPRAEREFDRSVLVAVGWATSTSGLPDAFDRARTALREAGDRPPPPAQINAYIRAQREPVPRW